MRSDFAKVLNEFDYLIHPDCWNKERFPSKARVISVGMREQLAINLAYGKAYAIEGVKTKESYPGLVFLYGTCQFLINNISQLKHSYKGGKVVIVNAGRVGYENIGPAHNTDWDEVICGIAGIKYFTVNEANDNFIDIIKIIKNSPNGVYYISLGSD